MCAAGTCALQESQRPAGTGTTRRKLDAALTPQQLQKHVSRLLRARSAYSKLQSDAHASITPAAIATGIHVYTLPILIRMNEQSVSAALD